MESPKVQKLDFADSHFQKSKTHFQEFEDKSFARIKFTLQQTLFNIS